MIAFLLSPLGKIVGAAAILVAAFLGFRIWLHTHDTAILKGYVLLAEKTAAEAKTAELQRQVNAGQLVINSYQEVARNAKAAEQLAIDTAEQRISEYEALLRNAGRSCGLNDDDIRMLQSQ